MKTEIKVENLNNIHVFRVNRATANVKEAKVNKSNYRTRLSAETKRSICEDHIENPKITQEALALKYGCKRTTVAKVNTAFTILVMNAKLISVLDYKIQRSLAHHW